MSVLKKNSLEKKMEGRGADHHGTWHFQGNSYRNARNKDSRAASQFLWWLHDEAVANIFTFVYSTFYIIYRIRTTSDEWMRRRVKEGEQHRQTKKKFDILGISGKWLMMRIAIDEKRCGLSEGEKRPNFLDEIRLWSCAKKKEPRMHLSIHLCTTLAAPLPQTIQVQ